MSRAEEGDLTGAVTRAGNASPKENRLSKQQLQAARERAAAFQQRLLKTAQGRVPQAQGEGAFFAALFHLAAQAIEADVDTFCDKAEATFEEIEAYGQEPALDIDWLAEVTGDKDNFYFSTENLVSDLISLPKRKRRQKQLSDEEKEQLRQQVEAAIIDEDPQQSFEQAISTAHAEDPQKWIELIKQALATNNSAQTFWALQRETELSIGELFLGLLLGQQNWNMKQDDFYDTVYIELIV